MDAIRARLDSATPGPWSRHGADVHAAGAGVILRGRDGSAEARRQGDLDAEFVAHARQDIAALLELLTDQAGRTAPDLTPRPIEPPLLSSAELDRPHRFQ